jgi:hypothetical protein
VKSTLMQRLSPFHERCAVLRGSAICGETGRANRFARS